MECARRLRQYSDSLTYVPGDAEEESVRFFVPPQAGCAAIADSDPDDQSGESPEPDITLDNLTECLAEDQLKEI